MVNCLENGIIPHVITGDGKDSYQLQTTFEENIPDTSSTNLSEIKKCLRSGNIPDAYKDVISNIEIKEVTRKVTSVTTGTIFDSAQEMIKLAKKGYFVRDSKRNLVYCPMCQILRQKSIKQNGNIRFANRTACKKCPKRNICYTGKNDWKEIDFPKDKFVKPHESFLSENIVELTQKITLSKTYFSKEKIVNFVFKPDISKTVQRKCLSEHPFGTIKLIMGAYYFLLRGLHKVTGEFSLFCLGYNIKRARNLLGFETVNTSLRVLLRRICVPYGHNLPFKSVRILSGAI